MNWPRVVLAASGVVQGWVFGLLLGLVPTGAGAEPAKPPDPFAPTMTFYVAKGKADACGRGCDTWIAAEGRIDSGASARLRKFLHQHGDLKLPIYLYSPGGNVDQALAMGRMLRQRMAVARVARTLVKGCATDAPQFDAACLKLKQTGREVEAELATRGAQCNSACPFLLVGATIREIAPDAVLAVHSPRVTVTVRVTGSPSKQLIAEAERRVERQGKERIDHSVSRYLQDMGIDHGMMDIIRTVKFESMHVLTRDEIAKFGIDRREFVDTPWVLEGGGKIHKIAQEKREGTESYHVLQWQISCINQGNFHLLYQRPNDVASPVASVSLSGEAPQALRFSYPPRLVPGYEIWQLRLPKAAMQSLAALSQVDLAETLADGASGQAVHSIKLSTDGLNASLSALQALCTNPAAGIWPSVPVPQAVGTAGGPAR